VVGISLDKKRVLLHTSEQDDFWSLPGGRGELLEPAEVTLKREMLEELDTEIEVIRLIWVVENFFDYDAKSYHELALYFLMAFSEHSPLVELTEFTGIENHLKLTFKWYALNDLTNIALYPSFLKTALNKIPSSTEHIVHRDDGL